MSRLSIYFTSDTHAYLYPTNFASRKPLPMGPLGMRFPKDGNTLVIDGGDTIQGSPMTYYAHAYGVELPIARAMNARGYDYFTLGNHDFNYGREHLKKYLDEMEAVCLCANVTDLKGEMKLFPSAVRVMENGLRVGLVGICTDWVNRWERPENLTGLTVSDPLEAAAEAARKLDCDVLVGIYHGGIERDLNTGRLLSETDENIACRICEKVPFDLLLTGHQHIGLANGKWGDTLIVQTPANAVGYIRVEMDESGRFSSELCPVPDHAFMTEEEASLMRDLDAWLDHPVGHLSRPIWPEDKLSMALNGSAIADLFNRVQLAASFADLSCAALANVVRGFDSQVTVRDVVASYVYSNTLGVKEVTGAVLKQGLEQCASYFDVDAEGRVHISEHFLRPKESHYNYDYFAGLDYTFDLRRPVGDRVTSMVKAGRPILPEDRLSLCMCNYRATGTGDFDFYRSCPVIREIQTDISELILKYLEDHPFVEIPDTHPITVIRP